MKTTYKGLSDSFYEIVLFRTINEILKNEKVSIINISDIDAFEYREGNYLGIIVRRENGGIAGIKLNVLHVKPYCIVASLLINGKNMVIKVYRNFIDRSIQAKYIQSESILTPNEICSERYRDASECIVYRKVTAKSEHTKYDHDTLEAKRELKQLTRDYEGSKKSHNAAIQDLYDNSPRANHSFRCVGFLDIVGSDSNESVYREKMSRVEEIIKKGSEEIIFDEEQRIPLL